MLLNLNSLLKSKRAVFIIEILLMTFITAVYTFKFKLGYNEMDIIPYARSVYNPEWLNADWYLSLKIPYRYLFSYVVGFFTEHYGIVHTVFWGRLLTYLFFSFTFIQLLKLVKLNYFLHFFILIIYLMVFQYGIGDVGEWMIGGLDTKVFAYCFALLSLVSFARKKYQLGLLFSGFTLSFHLLVGAYNLFCLAPIILLEQNQTKNYILKILKSSYIFLLSGSIGLYAIFMQFSTKVNSEIAKEAWNIYVNIRLPYHVTPHFSIKNSILIFLFSTINVLFLRSKYNHLKSLALYSLSSVFILIIGLLVFQFLDHQHLRYYFFRTSNVILPLITLILACAYLYEKFSASISNKNLYKTMSIAVIVLLLAIQFKSISALLTPKNYTPEMVLAKTNRDIKMFKWIKENTEENAVFLIPPYMEYFYVHAERAIHVAWKYSPQNPYDILEWHNRIKVINKNKNFVDLWEINDAYRELDENLIKNICEEYPDIDYVLLSLTSEVNIPVQYQTDKYALYRKSDFYK